jgi:plastocyanin
MPHRRVRTAAVAVAATAAAAAVLAVAASAHPRATHPTLVGTVGKNDAFRITLTRAGKLVKTLNAGTYTVVIHDDSAIHNYELGGPHGKSWTFTSVSFKGTKRFTLTLHAGAYKAYCAPHESSMFQRFTVR